MKAKALEISCPIYGFVEVEPAERRIVENRVFQRLRRIRQLGWTDSIYPGGMHTRFEHSLGVMHMATQLFEKLRERLELGGLGAEFHFCGEDFDRWRRIVRLAALLHDLGHGPFSHAAESVLPIDPKTGRVHDHEDYSIAAIKWAFPDVIAEYPEVLDLVSKSTDKPECQLWRRVISGEIDADRMDYLLRDAHHAGVPYGRYDWRRIVSTVDFFPVRDANVLRIGVRRGGRHAAESLLVARYMMFNCVYNHRTRVIVDYHIQEAIREMLPGGTFPPPTSETIEAYLDWDDWLVLGNLKFGQGGEHGKLLMERRFHKQVWATPELPSAEELLQFRRVMEELADLQPYATDATKTKPWYAAGGDKELLVEAENDEEEAVQLSRCSNLIGGLRRSERHRLFVPYEKRDEANDRLKRFPLKKDPSRRRHKAPSLENVADRDLVA